MICNYFWEIHITIEKITIGNTQPAHDEKSTRETTRDPQGTLRGQIQKLMIL